MRIPLVLRQKARPVDSRTLAHDGRRAAPRVRTCARANSLVVRHVVKAARILAKVALPLFLLCALSALARHTSRTRRTSSARRIHRTRIDRIGHRLRATLSLTPKRQASSQHRDPRCGPRGCGAGWDARVRLRADVRGGLVRFRVGGGLALLGPKEAADRARRGFGLPPPGAQRGALGIPV